MIKNFKWLKKELEVLAAALRVLLQIWPKFRFFPKDVSRPVEGFPMAIFDWIMLYCVPLECPELILVEFGKLFFGPTFFVRPLHGFGHFGWKHLGGSSKVSELDLMLGEPQSCNFLHEYPKLMWKGSRHKESDLSYFKKIQKKIFLRFGSPKIVKFWDSCKLV